MPTTQTSDRATAGVREHPDEAWTDNDVAKFFKVSRRTVWVWSKKVPDFPKPRQFRGVSRWSKAEVTEFFTAKK